MHDGRPDVRIADVQQQKGLEVEAFDSPVLAAHITFGSLNASGSPANASIGTQAQNTFLSPYTLSTRATGGQYFCRRSVLSGNTASSRGYACVHSLALAIVAVCGACLSGLSSRSS